jgi:hypothetical protein
MRTVTGLFDDYTDASAAVGDLESAGVRSSDISIVSNNADKRHGESNAAEGAGTGAGIGAVVGGAGGLLTGLGLMAIPGVGPVVAAGWLAATAAGAVAGGAAGGIIGGLTSSGVSERDAHFYAEGVRRGGTLVTAKVDEALAPEAEAILKRSNWVDPAARRAVYEQQGWSRFDETLDPYDAEQIEQERLRYRRNGI